MPVRSFSVKEAPEAAAALKVTHLSVAGSNHGFGTAIAEALFGQTWRVRLQDAILRARSVENMVRRSAFRFLR